MIAMQGASPPLINFKWEAVEDAAASREAGRPIFRDVPFVEVTPPGGHLKRVAPAEQWLETKRRESWYDTAMRHFEEWRKTGETPVDGTRIDLAPFLTPAQIKTCISVGCRAIETLAEWPDGALSQFGPGAVKMKQLAQAYLAAANDVGKTAARLQAAELENKELKEQVADLRATLETLMAERPKRGRPRKQLDDADDASDDDTERL